MHERPPRRTQALINAHNRGVKVKVIIDKVQAGNQYADDEMLENSVTEVRRDKAGGLMHKKFCIKDIGIAHIYKKQFQKLWEKHK